MEQGSFSVHDWQHLSQLFSDHKGIRTWISRLKTYRGADFCSLSELAHSQSCLKRDQGAFSGDRGLGDT